MNNTMKNKILLLILFLSFFFQYKIIAQSKKDSIMILDNGSYLVASKNVEVVINPAEGARITSFKLEEYEFLVGKDNIPESYGSTFWPGPQSTWNWPPPPALDYEPYSAVDGGSSIKLTGRPDQVTGFQFVKEFSAGENNSINLSYTIINKTKEVKKAAPWEISRVHKGGLLFFPIGQKPLGVKSFEPADIDILNGIAWYKDKLARPENNRLSTADGKEGWAAYAINGKLFIKKFKDVEPAMIAPGEGEVMLYVASKADYNEFEIEGEYQTLKPGEESTWNVEWIGIDIPANIKIEKGNMELVNFVRNIVK